MSCNRCDKCNVPINAIKPDVFKWSMSGYNILCVIVNVYIVFVLRVYGVKLSTQIAI